MTAWKLIDDRRPQEPPRQEVSMEGRGSLRSGCDPRPRVGKLSDLNCPDATCPSRVGLPQDLWRGNESRVGSLCEQENDPHSGTARGVVPDPDRLTEPVWAHRQSDAATRPSPWSVVRAPRGKARRLQGPGVVDRNAGTRVRVPAGSTPASSAESSEGRTRGRSSRSSLRPGERVTWRRGVGTS